MDSSGPSTYGEAEARRTSYSNGHESTTLPMRTMASFQSRSSVVWPPDARVLSTSEQGSHLPGRSEGVIPLHWGTTRAELEHAFQKPMQQYKVDELTVEWDGLFQGDGSIDLHNPADVYRELRKDLRSLACVMKQSFRFVIDDRRWPSGGTGPSSNGVLHLEPCLSELRSVAQDIVNATRSASDHRIELERLRQSNHLLQAQVHEAHVSLMTTEVERNDALSRLAAAELAIAAEAKRAAGSEAVRNQNNVLQAQLQEAGGEIKELEEMVRALEEKLEATKEEAEGLAAQLRAKEAQAIGNTPHARKLPNPSEAGASDQEDTSFHDTRRSAVISAAHSSKQPRCTDVLDHHTPGQCSAAGPAPGGDLVESGDAHWMGLANALVKGSQVEVRLREMPPELRRDVQQWVAQLIRKLKEDKDDSKAGEVLSVQGKPLDADATVKAAPMAMQCGRRQAAPGTAGSISAASAASACPLSATDSEMLHAHDGADLATHLAADLVDPHLRLPVSNTQAPGELHPQQQQQSPFFCAQPPSHQSVTTELEAARETIARLTAELAETRQAHGELQQRLLLADKERAAMEASRAETQTTLEEAVRHATQAAETAEAQAAAQAALVAEAQVRIGEMQKAMQQAVEARIALEAELQDLPVSRQQIASLESQLASCATVIKELEGRRNDTEQREARERQARDAAAKELEAARQRIVRLQADLRESRSDAKIARSEAIAASRDAKAANSGLVKAQREMEEAVQRLSQVESERDALAAALATAQGKGQAAQATAREEAAVAETLAKAQVNLEASGNEQQKALESEGKSPHAMTAPLVEAVDVKLLALELEVAQRELAAAKTRLAEEQSISKQEAARLEAKVKALEADLVATRAELAAAEAAYRERLAAVEARLVKAEADQKPHIAETLLLQESLAKAQQRVEELEALQQAMEQDSAVAMASSSAEAQERLRQLESQLRAVETALQQAEQQYSKELDSLRTQLAEAQQATAAAMAAVEAAEAAAKQSNGSNVSPERAAEDAKACIEGQQPEDEDEVDIVVLRARCRAWRAELTRVRSALASVLETWEAAAQDRLAEKLAEAQAAAATGRIKTDGEFWTHNHAVHSLYALVNALRTSSMYTGAPGALAAYGDNRADGAGSFGAANCSLLGTSYRRLRHHQYLETLAQMDQLLAGAAEALLRRPAPPPLPQQQQPGLGGRTDRVSASGRGRESTDGHQSQGRSTGHGQSRNGSGVAAADAAGRRANGCHQPGPSLPAGRGVAVVANSSSPRRLGRHDVAAGNNLSGGGAAQFGACAGTADVGSLPAIEASKGASLGLLGTMDRQPAPPVASSSFTSDTGSTRLEDDLANISLLYEIPPMGSPPKYDFSSWTWE
ncbi:hypothetical protein Vretimale_659 [Volvox reticuliferus]|uniref:Uncharacterized protein n=1 Tax=Volvox reticuliferus TaxID=1737510 RepID=A0A8J4C0Q0_9CHLO|nr:hypothetical protein Vretifemale_2345 [Volvox reticuliferus]GIL94459.1 hypothetical protein Vretimale_659 [Volvox reticuliferus]